MSKVEFATSMDSTLHFRGDCCRDRKCRRCGGREHFQGIYGGCYIETCESCDVDLFQPAVRDDSVEGGHFLETAEDWKAAGFDVMAWTPDEDLGKPIILTAEGWDALTKACEGDGVPNEQLAALMRRSKP